MIALQQLTNDLSRFENKCELQKLICNDKLYIENFNIIVDYYKNKPVKHDILNDNTVIVCNFNNTYLTLRMLESMFYAFDSFLNVIIIDNSDTTKIDDKITKNITIVDNMNYKLTNNYYQCSKNHCATIDYALKNLVNTRYVMVCDNDVIFKPGILDVLNNMHEYDLLGTIGKCWVPPDRIMTYWFMMDNNRFKAESQNYFDTDRCALELNKRVPTTILRNGIVYKVDTGLMYDTGASFYDDIRYLWKIKDLNSDDLYIHLRAGSHMDENKFNKYFYLIDYKYNTVEEFIEQNKCYFIVN